MSRKAGRHKLLGQILREMELIEERQVLEALTLQARQGARIGEILESLGHVTREQILQALAIQKGKGAVPDPAESNDRSPAIRLVDLILGTALAADATEIRMEPQEEEFRIRYRVDGVLHDLESPPRFLVGGILARLREMARLEPGSSRTGRFYVALRHRSVELTLSIHPTPLGESAVLRPVERPPRIR